MKQGEQMNETCMICNSILQMKNTQTVRLWDNDNRSHFDIVGCIKCTDDVHKQINNVTDLKKKSIDKVLKEINLHHLKESFY